MLLRSLIIIDMYIATLNYIRITDRSIWSRLLGRPRCRMWPSCHPCLQEYERLQIRRKTI